MRAEFDLDPGITYLNSGTHSLAPRSVLEAVEREQREFERNPTENLNLMFGRLWDVQKKLARFLGARPQDLFLAQNVTSPMNAGLLGFELAPGGELLASDVEYAAMLNVCRFRCDREGRKLRTFALPTSREALKGMTEDQLAERVTRELRPETRLLMLSHVVTGTGLVLPIEKIARETRKRGIRLVVDGAHATGFLDVDFSRLDDVDLYAANLHKWVMGPKGTGFGWVPERAQGELEPLQAGWTTFETQAPYSSFGDGSRWAAKFLPAACQNFAPYLAVPETLAFWKRHGAAKIRGRIRELQREVDSRMTEMTGWASASPEVGPLLGPLLTYELPPAAEKRGFEFMRDLLRETGVQISSPKVQGRTRVRISPHVYNTSDEIARGVKALAEFAGRGA